MIPWISGQKHSHNLYVAQKNEQNIIQVPTQCQWAKVFVTGKSEAH